MTTAEKTTIITKMTNLLLAELEAFDKPTAHEADDEQPIEMLTLKECTDVVKGLTTHAVRHLVLQGKIPALRVGEGKYGKILVTKAALLEYVEREASKPIEAAN